MKNFRDIEQLSSYLDGQLSPSESVRLESRLSSDPQLASALIDLRAARGILRKLPLRKASRNFTLTRQMVGLKPPLPRSYSFFRFSTTFATVLLMFTFAANALTQLPRMTFGVGAPAPVMQEGYGGMGGGPSESALVTETPAAMEEAPAAPALEMQPLPTANADSAPMELPTAKEAATPSELQDQPPVQSLAAPESIPQEQSRSQTQALIPFAWQIALCILILFSGLTAFLLRRSAIQKWK
jgi:anti-sigma factor RsiW